MAIAAAEQNKANETPAEDSVEYARAMAAKMNAQMEAGVKEAEERKKMKDMALEVQKKQGGSLSQLFGFGQLLKPSATSFTKKQ